MEGRDAAQVLVAALVTTLALTVLARTLTAAPPAARGRPADGAATREVGPDPYRDVIRWMQAQDPAVFAQLQKQSAVDTVG